MFFPEKIISIKETDRVLEVGPGGTPHPRSDVLLEKIFDEKEAEAQRGFTNKLQTDRKIIYYHGGSFPFQDNEFDYVICSHVLEHVPEADFSFFISELTRVAKKGYIEFPTIYYDYLYNFDEHVTMPFYRDNTIYYMSKNKSHLSMFRDIQEFFYSTAVKGHICLTKSLEQYYFQGFEWKDKIYCEKAKSITQLLYTKKEIANITQIEIHNISCIQKLKNRIKQLFKIGE